MRAATVFVCCSALLGGIACAQARPAAQPGQQATVAFSSEDDEVAVELRSVSGSPSASSCRLPCTLHTTSGPARASVRHASRNDESSVELAAGTQRARVRPSDPTLQALGWVLAGAAVVSLSIGIYAATKFETDSAPAPPGAASPSTPAWAKVALTSSILSIVPLSLGSVYLLDRGSGSIELESRSAAIRWTSRF